MKYEYKERLAGFFDIHGNSAKKNFFMDGSVLKNSEFNLI